MLHEWSEQVARVHVAKLGGKLTTLSWDQAEYIGVRPVGPYKCDDYGIRTTAAHHNSNHNINN